MQPLISIILPARDAANTLCDAVDSMLAQSLGDWELVAVDDGSRDATTSMLEEYSRKDERIRVERFSESRGIVAALNRATELARGGLLARMDADDFSQPQRLELQSQLLYNHSELDVASCMVAPHPDGLRSDGLLTYLHWVNGLREHDAMMRERFIESPLPHPSVMMRRAAYEKVGGYRDMGWPEDYDLWLRMFAAGMRFGKVESELLFWRDAPGRASRAQAMYSIESFQRCKIHHLMRGPLRDAREFYIWGAGRYAKQALKLLLAEGCRPCGLIDIDPDKIGKSVPNEPGGAPVIAPEELPEAGKDRIIISAVGSRASDRARNEIRQALMEKNYIEGRNFWCLA